LGLQAGADDKGKSANANFDNCFQSFIFILMAKTIFA
jgi:hypothetical protein